MITNSKIKIIANLGIRPINSLNETARLVESAVCGLSLEPDSSGKYEEFPALVGSLLGIDFALLGEMFMGFDEQVSGEKHFELQLSTKNRETEVFYDVSEHVCEFINGSGKLDCWVLKSEREKSK